MSDGGQEICTFLFYPKWAFVEVGGVEENAFQWSEYFSFHFLRQDLREKGIDKLI